MNIKKLSFGCAILAASVAMGAAVDFPGAGGDLASAADWGGTRPAATESVNLVNAGTYTLSDDVTFSQLLIPSAGSTLSFGAKTFTITSTGNFGFHFTAPGLTVVDGGVFDLSGVANFHGAYNNYKGKIHTVLTNGCVVTNVSCFYATRYSEGNTTEVTGGSKVYTDEIRLTNDDSYDNTFEVSGGSEIHLTNRFYYDVNAKTAGVHGGNKFIVRGDGSLYHQVNSYMMQLGNQQHDDLFWVTDGARAYSENGGINVGNGATTNAQVRIDDRATATFPSVDIRGTDGLVTVANCATATITKLTFTKGRNKLMVTDGANAAVPTVVFNAGDNAIVVSNADFTSKTSFLLGASAVVCGNSARFCGPDTHLGLVNIDWYGAGAGHAVAFSGGIRYTNQVNRNNFMYQTRDSRLDVTGEGTVLGDVNYNFYIGGKDLENCCSNNVIAITDGAILNACRYCLMGTGNETIVSNATLHVGNDSVGLRIGYRISGYWSTNCVLTLAGRTPQVKVDAATNRNGCIFDNGATLRFVVPEEGYDPDVPVIDAVCAFAPAPGSSKIEIDGADFVAKTGGKLHLVRTGVDISAKVTAMLNAVELPPKCRLIVEKRNVYLKSPKRTGLSITIR